MIYLNSRLQKKFASGIKVSFHNALLTKISNPYLLNLCVFLLRQNKLQLGLYEIDKHHRMLQVVIQYFMSFFVRCEISREALAYTLFCRERAYLCSVQLSALGGAHYVITVGIILHQLEICV